MNCVLWLKTTEIQFTVLNGSRDFGIKKEEVALESLNKKRKAKDDNNEINRLQIYHDLWEEESEEDEDKKMAPGKQILGNDNWKRERDSEKDSEYISDSDDKENEENNLYYSESL